MNQCPICDQPLLPLLNNNHDHTFSPTCCICLSDSEVCRTCSNIRAYHTVCYNCVQTAQEVRQRQPKITRNGPTAGMCPVCKYGPLDVNNHCGSLFGHHLQRLRDAYPGSSTDDKTYSGWNVNSCPQCSFFCQDSSGWIPWDCVERPSAVDVWNTIVHVSFNTVNSSSIPGQYLLLDSESRRCLPTLVNLLLQNQSYSYAIVTNKDNGNQEAVLLRYRDQVTLAFPKFGTTWIWCEGCDGDDDDDDDDDDDAGDEKPFHLPERLVEGNCVTGATRMTPSQTNQHMNLVVSGFRPVTDIIVFGAWKIMMPYIDNSEVWGCGVGLTNLTMEPDGFRSAAGLIDHRPLPAP